MEGIALNQIKLAEQVNGNSKPIAQSLTDTPEVNFEEMIINAEADQAKDVNNNPIIDASQDLQKLTQSQVNIQTNIEIKSESLLLLQQNNDPKHVIDLSEKIAIKDTPLSTEQQKQDISKILRNTGADDSKVNIKTINEPIAMTKDMNNNASTKLMEKTNAIANFQAQTQNNTNAKPQSQDVDPEIDLELKAETNNKEKTITKAKNTSNNERFQSSKIEQKSNESQQTIKSINSSKDEGSKHNEQHNNKDNNSFARKTEAETEIINDNNIKSSKEAKDFENSKSITGKDNNATKDLSHIQTKDQHETKTKPIEQVNLNKLEKTETEPKAQKISEQIVTSIRKNLPFSGSNKHYQINLNPKDMGEVSIKMQIARDGLIKASFMMEEFKAFDILQQNSNALQKSLEDVGYKVEKDSLNFSMQNQGSNNNNNKDNQKNNFNRIYEHGKGILNIQEVGEQELETVRDSINSVTQYQININIRA